MYIEQIFKLKLKPDEADLLKRCETLLEDILHNFDGDYLEGILYDDIASVAEILQQLYDNKELY